MKLSVFYDHMREAAQQSGKSLAEVCRLVKSFGICGVEIEQAYYLEHEEEVVPLLQQAGLKVNCMYQFFDFAHEAPERRTQQIRRFVDTAKAAGSQNVLVVPGFLTEEERKLSGEAYQQLLAKLRDGVAELCDYGERQGITVGMEDFDGIQAPFATISQLLYFLEGVPKLVCNFDTGNFLYSEEDALEAYEKCKPYIQYVHCKDRTFEVHEGENPVITTAGRKMYAASVGSGCIPMREILSDLLQNGYNGVFAIEHFGSLRQLEDIEASAKWLLALGKEFGA